METNITAILIYFVRQRIDVVVMAQIIVQTNRPKPALSISSKFRANRPKPRPSISSKFLLNMCEKITAIVNLYCN